MSRQHDAHGFLWHLADALLSLVDWACRVISSAGLWLFRGLLRLLLLALRGALALLCLPFRLLAAAFSARKTPQERCLELTGEEFEEYCALILRDNGFRHVELTPMGGDQGIDILAVKSGESWAVQCKNYRGAVGNAAVQEACAGREYYGCDRAAVLCPGEYTRAARELAASADVELWDGERLARMMRRSGRRPRHDPGRT